MSGKGKLWKSSLVDGFKDTGSKILEIVREIPPKIAEIGGFYAAGQSNGQNYKRGFEDIINGIQTPDIPDVQTGTQTRTTTRTMTTNSRGNPMRRILHNGGPVYLAEGGNLFKPRGTDTVPAMLTPGEYVHRKEAVSLFGQEFMDKVNSLDVKGALTSLSSRIGTKLMGGTTVHNYNNQQVIQHIHTNNENWSYMRANKFVRGLS